MALGVGYTGDIIVRTLLSSSYCVFQYWTYNGSVTGAVFVWSKYYMQLPRFYLGLTGGIYIKAGDLSSQIVCYHMTYPL